MGRVPEACCDTAVRPALLMGRRGDSAVDIVLVTPGTISSVGTRVW